MISKLLFGALVGVCAGVLSSPSPAQVSCPQWSSGLGAPGVDGRVHALERLDLGAGEALYAGGLFSAVVDRAACSVAAWDGAAWTPLAAGIDGVVYALEVFDDGKGPALYAGGEFDTAGGSPAASLARWDGSKWTEVGGGIGTGGGVRVLALQVFDDGSGPALYVAGELTSVGGLPVSGIARWDGSTWSDVGGGIFGEVRALEVFDDGNGPALYAGGSFVHAYGATVNHVARWDGSSWSDLAGGVTVGSSYDGVWALDVHDDGWGPGLIVGGVFTIGSTVENVARWDGAAWSDLGGGLKGQVRALAVHDDGAGERLWAGGSFAGGHLVARFDAGAWAAPGALSGSALSQDVVHALGDWPAGQAGGPALLAGGEIAITVPALGRSLAAWTAGQWTTFGGDQKGLDWGVTDLELFDDGTGPSLYAGGAFTATVDGSAMRLARWDGTGWVEAPGAANHLRFEVPADLEACGPGGDLLAGLHILSQYPSSLLHWDGAAWTNLGPVPGAQWDAGATVMELYDDGSGGGEHLFVGGDLGHPMSQWGIVEWDGTTWQYLGSGIYGYVKALAVFDDGGGPALYVGGNFGSAGGQPASGIARWDGAVWSALGAGVAGEVSALAVHDDGSGSALYVGGDFDQAGGQPAAGIARWDGQAWSALGGGLSGGAPFPAVSALGVYDDGSGAVLVAGGPFDQADGQPARGLAVWDGTTWTELGGGVSSGPSAILQVDQDLWLAGDFGAVGSLASWHVARWSDACGSDPSTYCTAKVNSQGCTPQVSWSGNPSATARMPFVVLATNVVNQKNGLFFYGLAGPAATAFHGGFLCVAPPVSRTWLQWSGGNPPPDDCSGTFALDFNGWLQTGADPGLVVGAQVYGQYWYRDPLSASTTGLSDAIAFTILP